MNEAEAQSGVRGSEEFPVTNSTTCYCTRFTAGNAEVAINRAGTHLTGERSSHVCLTAKSLIDKLRTSHIDDESPFRTSDGPLNYLLKGRWVIEVNRALRE
jgi:hypothetical protein